MIHMRMRKLAGESVNLSIAMSLHRLLFSNERGQRPGSRAFRPALIFLLLAAAHAGAAELVISKAERSLEYRGEGVSRKFPVGLGSAPTGRKSRQGDRKTPEGVYFITQKNTRSQFYLSLGISYPNIEDAKAGTRSRLISNKEYTAIETAIRQRRLPPQNTALGGDIFIHGGGSQSDWTWGCIALNNADIAFLFKHVRVGDKVTIRE